MLSGRQSWICYWSRPVSKLDKNKFWRPYDDDSENMHTYNAVRTASHRVVIALRHVHPPPGTANLIHIRLCCLHGKLYVKTGQVQIQAEAGLCGGGYRWSKLTA